MAKTVLLGNEKEKKEQAQKKAAKAKRKRTEEVLAASLRTFGAS